MKTKILLINVVLIAFFYGCKSDADKKPIENIGFEDVELGSEGFYNGSDGKGGFKSGTASFANKFTPEFGSWSGWAASSKTDTANKGAQNFTNQYSVYAQSGGNGSLKFAVAYAFDSSVITLASPAKAISCQIANSTYAYHDMKNGSMFSKKFGDGDFFLLTIEGFGLNNQKTGEVKYYLADFRVSAPVKGIKVGWNEVGLAPLGIVKKIRFKLSSSDSGEFGMNNPAYFCFDNLKIE